MRILHILDHSVPLHSGYAFRTLAILRQQRRLGWETVQLTSPKQGPSALAEEEAEGLTFQRTPASRAPYATWPALGEWALMHATKRRLAGLAAATRPDILHAHSPALNAWPALWVGRRLDLPVVYEVRGFWEDAAVSHGTCREGDLRYRLGRGLETLALRRADALTTICEGLRNEMIGRGIPAERITVIPNAVDVDAFGGARAPDAALARELGLEGKLVLGFLGSFYAYEGLDLLIRALPRLCTRLANARLLLVGGGPEAAALEALARDCGVADRVVFTGRVAHDRVQRYYDLVEVAVYPRHPMRLTELVTPLKPLEAMAQGKIVLASDVGGHRELIAPNETGHLFHAGDMDDLIETVVRIDAARAYWPDMRARARSYVEVERCWPVSVGRYRSVYAALARARADQRAGIVAANPARSRRF